MKLVPAQRLALALAPQQPEPVSGQQQPGVRAIRAQSFGAGFLLAGGRASQRDDGERYSANPAKPHHPDCVIATQRQPSAPRLLTPRSGKCSAISAGYKTLTLGRPIAIFGDELAK